jgi:predicted RNase H-like HicB family nuclease
LVQLAIRLAPAESQRNVRPSNKGEAMKIKVVVHEAEEGGFWAEVPAIPGCATQGETFEELLQNLYEAIEGCLSVDIAAPTPGGKERVLEIAI